MGKLNDFDAIGLFGFDLVLRLDLIELVEPISATELLDLIGLFGLGLVEPVGTLLSGGAGQKFGLNGPSGSVGPEVRARRTHFGP